MAYSTTTYALVELVLPASPASVREARVAVGDAVAEIAADERLADDIRLCVSEAVTNAVRHAYGAEAGTVQVVVTREGDDLLVVVRDEGAGIGRRSRRPDEPGGFGLEIIDRLTTRLALESAPNAGTEVPMVFALPSRAPLEQSGR